MTEATRKKIVYAASAVALTWAAFNYPWGKKADRQSETPAVVAQEAAQIAKATPVRLNIPVEKAKAWGKDPFRAPAKVRKTGPVAAAPQKEWIVAGILYNPSKPMAYVNGRAVGVGDVVEGAEIVSIERKQVTLIYRGNQFTVAVNKG
jgi:hypothetical protein